MVIVLHGAGADEKDLLDLLSSTGFGLRVVSLRGPAKYQRGYTWAKGDGESAKAAQLAYVEDFKKVGKVIAHSVAELQKKYRTKGKPFVLGFSVGASMALYLGLHHSDRFAGVFAVSGKLDQEYYPATEGLVSVTAPIYTYHGKTDPVIPFAEGKKVATKFRQYSPQVYFKEFEGGHTIPPNIISDVSLKMRKLLGL